MEGKTASVGVLPELEDAYYSVTVSSRASPEGDCRLLAAIHRKDSGEQVDCIIARGEREEQALALLKDEVIKCLRLLRRPPHEWGRLQLRQLLIDYRKHNNDIVSLMLKIEKARASNSLSNETLSEYLSALIQKAEIGAVQFAARLSALSEEDRVDLMTAADETYGNLDNPWNLDDVSGRNALYYFIINPSEPVRIAHEKHRAHKS